MQYSMWIRTWEEARRADAFPTHIRKMLQNPALSWRLEKRRITVVGLCIRWRTDKKDVRLICVRTVSNNNPQNRQLFAILNRNSCLYICYLINCNIIIFKP